mmetsp:Transcript_75345/g.232551  ORF Transcript_75345/g.232551 Transcript_75345/m.232551 type:complete len:229 (-) Transcript_75345:458-1144(-)
MHPSLEAVAVDLGPDVVGPIMHVPCLVPKRAADQREAVRPLAAAAVPGLQQLAGIVVSREARLQAAVLALRNLYTASAKLLLHLRGPGGAHRSRVRRAAVLAPWGVCPGEEAVLEPSEDLTHEGHVVALLPAGAGGRGVDATDGDVIERLPLESSILVLAHVVKAVDLLLQPRRRTAELRLQQRQVLLLHQALHGVCACLLHFEGIVCREVPQDDDFRRPVRRRRGGV